MSIIDTSEIDSDAAFLLQFSEISAQFAEDQQKSTRSAAEVRDSSPRFDTQVADASVSPLRGGKIR